MSTVAIARCRRGGQSRLAVLTKLFTNTLNLLCLEWQIRFTLRKINQQGEKSHHNLHTKGRNTRLAGADISSQTGLKVIIGILEIGWWRAKLDFSVWKTLRAERAKIVNSQGLAWPC
ncbi:hypothetical protein ACTWPT_17810 [Nonomuraea sp. 3N208]|uniref:hypothetical protein n=1 Tax=Nonomuraea sp. 3N208 TaxID=3457421 RepID=UPI003FCC7563